ncbi:hypothetical protein [Aliarcobacter cryaerophilus]|nr:hypothetical protein [Aliarcobacter cryaerophilus]
MYVEFKGEDIAFAALAKFTTPPTIIALTTSETFPPFKILNLDL